MLSNGPRLVTSKKPSTDNPLTEAMMSYFDDGSLEQVIFDAADAEARRRDYDGLQIIAALAKVIEAVIASRYGQLD